MRKGMDRRTSSRCSSVTRSPSRSRTVPSISAGGRVSTSRSSTGRARGVRPSRSSATARAKLAASSGEERAIATVTLPRTMTVTETDAARALRTALSRGGEWAELFWERSNVVTLTLDDNKLEDAITGVDQGAGIRVTSGDRGVYANGNVNDGDDLLAIAGRAAAAIADDGGVHEVTAISADELPRPSLVRVDPRTVPIDRKVALMKLANERARA